MKHFDLTPNELEELKSAHKSVKNKKHAYKINAVILLGSGWTVEEVAEALLLDKNTLRDYAKKYRQGGVSGLLQTFYKGRSSYLSDSQQMELKNHLSEYTYSEVKGIIHHVSKTYNILYRSSGMTKLLHHLGFSYKKPKSTTINRDLASQVEFLQKYEMLRRAKIQVYFADGCHPNYNSRPDYGWVLKGHEKLLPSTNGKKRINIQGAVNIETKELVVKLDEKNLDQKMALSFIKKIHKRHGKTEKICIILDNAGYYKSKIVKAYVEENKNLDILYLPPYCPHLNLIERVWKYFYKQTISNRYYERFEMFVEGCKKFFRRSHRKKLKSLLTEKFHFSRKHSTDFKSSFQVA